MLEITWKYCCIFALVFMAADCDIRTDEFHGILPDNLSSGVALDKSQDTVKLSVSPVNVQTEDRWQNEEKGAMSRRKRNVLFPSGVKLCAEETMEQAIANHLDYFHLRVCQETVWEAFKIFWDRLPEQDEYQDWMTICREGKASTLEIGTNFSRSPDHLALVHSRVQLTGLNGDPSNSWLHLCSPQTTAATPSEPDAVTTQKEEMNSAREMFAVGVTPEATPSTVNMEVEQEVTVGATQEVTAVAIQEVTLGAVPEATAQVTPEETLTPTPQTAAATTTTASQPSANKLEEDLINNEIGVDVLRPVRPPRERVVELSIQLKGETYSSALRDPSSFRHQLLAQQFTEKIEDAFERLPGFKSVSVLDFRPQRDAKGDTAVVVHYAITLEVDGGISKETLDYINLQSNLVGNSYLEPDERPTVVYTITDFRNYITEALHKENFIGNTTLAVDPESLQLENVETMVSPEGSEPSKAADEDMDNFLAAEKPPDVPGEDLSDNDISNSGFSKDDFLYDPVHSNDPWVGAQGVADGENDVIVLDESPTLPTPLFPDVNLEPTPKTESITHVPGTGNDDSGGLENEGLLHGDTVVPNTPPTVAKETTPAATGPEIPGLAEAPPGGHGEEFTVDLSDTGSGSGISAVEAESLLPTVSTRGPIEPEAETVIILEEGLESESPAILDMEGPLFQDNLDPTIQTEDTIEVAESEKDQRGEDLLVDADVRGHLDMAPSTHDEHHESDPSAAIVPVPDYDSTPGAPIMDPQTTVGPELVDTTTLVVELLSFGPSSMAPSVNEPIGEPVAPEHQDVDLGLTSTEAPTYVDVELATEEPTVGVVEQPAVEPFENMPPFFEYSEEGDDARGVQILEEEEALLPTATKDPSSSIVVSEDDMAEDEIIAIPMTTGRPLASETQTAASPTLLSHEKESPFTRVADSEVEITLTALPPFYQPTFRPTEGSIDTELPSEEGSEGISVSATVKPALLDPTLTHELGDQVSKTELEVFTFSIMDLDESFDVFHYGGPGFTDGDISSGGYPSEIAHGTDMASIAKPNNGSSPTRALMVFFSLRVTNMIFSEDLFNKSSPEYKALEQRFLELLVPYLQSNLSNFQNLEILNFRNGSIVVNSRMKFGKPVPQGVTGAVYLILEDFCNTAYQTMNLAIDKYSLDVESGEQADPCKFQACNEFSECKVNPWSGEAECVCNAGYFSVDGLPCQSVCELQRDFCMNDGKCDIIPGQGAICRCRVGENWWYRGEHCEEYVSEPLVVGIAIASVAGFLLVASGVIFFLARTLRDQYDKEETEDPIRRGESIPSLERATKYNPMYESDITTGYSHYYQRYPEMPCYSSASAEASTDFSSEEIRHIYENSELTREEIQDRIRIIELYAKDRQFADFVRQHQVAMDIRRESSST